MSNSSALNVPGEFHNASRFQQSFLAGAEKRCLVWMARRVPAWVQPDHLTVLGLAAMFLAGLSYAAARSWAPALWLVNVWLAVNWFGDSLDGTLARERRIERPRYGFYVDHIVDSFGALFLIGGLALSEYMSWPVAVSLLIGFYLLSINAYLATYTLGSFRLSYWKFSPTEVRVLLAVGNIFAFRNATVEVFSSRHLLFDIGGAVAIFCMAVVLVASVTMNTVALYRMEPR